MSTLWLQQLTDALRFMLASVYTATLARVYNMPAQNKLPEDVMPFQHRAMLCQGHYNTSGFPGRHELHFYSIG